MEQPLNMWLVSLWLLLLFCFKKQLDGQVGFGGQSLVFRIRSKHLVV